MISKASKIQDLLVSHAVLIPPVLSQTFLDFAKLLRFGEGDCNVAALEEFATQKWLTLRQTLETRAVWLDQQIENGIHDVADDETDMLIASHLRTITLMTSNEPIECKIVVKEGVMEVEEGSNDCVEMEDGIQVLVFRSVTAEIVEIHSRFGTLTETIVNSAFYSTCCDGNIEVARLYLALGASPNWECPARRNLLERASSSGKYDVVQFLLSVTDLQFHPHEAFAPLLYACSEGHLEIIRLLLSNARISDWLKYSSQADDNNQILTCAVRFGHTDVVRMLIAEEPNVFCPFAHDRSTHARRRGFDFESALCIAAQTEQVDLVKIILEYGVTRQFNTMGLHALKYYSAEVNYTLTTTLPFNADIYGLLTAALRDFACIETRIADAFL